MKGPAQMPGKKAVRIHSVPYACPRRGPSLEEICCLHSFQPEEGCELIWDAKQGDGGWDLRRSAGVARQTLCPRQAIMGTLATCKRHGRAGRCGNRSHWPRHVHALAAHDLHTSPSVRASRPITPQQGGGTHLERMEQDAHLTRLSGLFAIPLTLFPQLTGTTICNSGCVDDAQTVSLFTAPFAWQEPLVCRATHRSIGLEGKGFSREAPGFPSSSNHRRSVALRLLTLGGSRSKLRSSYRGWAELMAQLQAEIPEPLRDDLPALLAARGVRAPTVRLLLLVFIGKGRFKRPSMQIQLDHIAGRERLLREPGQEEFIDNAFPRFAHPAFRLACWMSCHHHAARAALWSYWNFGAVVESACDLTFWTTLVLIRGEMQPRLHERVIEHGVIFAAHHKRIASKGSDNNTRPILPIQSQESALWGELVRHQVASNGGHCLAQLLAVLSIAPIAPTAEPLGTVSLRDDRAGTHHFSSLASRVPSSTQFLQPTRSGRQVGELWQGPLAGCFSGAIDVKDEPAPPTAIHQSPGLPLLRKGPRHQVVEKEAPQGLYGLLCERRQKARKRRACRQTVAPKERHEGRGKGLHPLVEGLQGALGTDRVAEEDRQKVDHLVVAETTAGKADVLTDLGQDSLLAKLLGNQGCFAEPGRRTGHILTRGLNDHRGISVTTHVDLLVGNDWLHPHQGGIFLYGFATGYSSLRIAWVLGGYSLGTKVVPLLNHIHCVLLNVTTISGLPSPFISAKDTVTGTKSLPCIASRAIRYRCLILLCVLVFV